MTIKEKIQKIVALAMSIKATDRYCLSICWDSETNHVDIYVHKQINGESQGVVQRYTYDGVRNNAKYISYDAMMDQLERMKREWGEV